MQKKEDDIAILILAAGASSRMGRAKQLLPWGDTTLLENSIVNALGTDTKNISVILGANAATIKKHIPKGKAVFTVNPDWESGLGSSLAFGVDHLLSKDHDIDGILVTLCDQPLLDSRYLGTLMNRFKKGNKGIVATRYGDRGGVPAIFSRKYFPELKRLNHDFGAKKLLELHKKDVFLMDPKGKAVDVDTYEDYENLVRKFF